MEDINSEITIYVALKRWSRGEGRRETVAQRAGRAVEKILVRFVTERTVLRTIHGLYITPSEM